MGKKSTIFISPYRNFSIRYILYSDIFQELRNSGARIVVFIKDNDVEYYRELIGGGNVIVEPVLYEKAMGLLKKNRINRLFTLIRKCMSGGTEDFRNTTDGVRLYMYGKELSRGIMGWLEFQMVKLFSALGKKSVVFRKALVAWETRIFPGDIYDKYFKKYNPELLIVSSIGYMIDPYFMRAAKRHRCKALSIIHSWDNPTTKDYRGAEPDYVITWNDVMKREVNVFHDIPAEKIFVGGIAHWDFYFNGSFVPCPREQFLKHYELSPDRKTIFYATSNYVLFRNTFDVIEQILEKIRSNSFIVPLQLLVRLHPGYLLMDKGREVQVVDRFKERMDSIKGEFGDLVTFTTPMMKVLNDDIDMPVEDMYRLAEMFYHSDVLLNEYSTVMIEAAVFNLPIINVGLFNFRDTEKPASYLENYTHIKRLLRTGASKNAYTMDQIIEHLNSYLKDPTQDKNGRESLLNQEISVNRGVAGKTIGEYILSLLNGDK